MWIKNKVWLLFLIFSISSCVEEYWPNVEKYEDLIVVDGLMTNGSNAVEIKLSVSSPVNDKKFIPLSDAEIYINDNDGMKISLTETETGAYKAQDSAFAGQVGKVYQLNIKLLDGRIYQSDSCVLMPPVTIDSVYGINESPDISTNEHQYPGIQFYVENHAQTTDTTYYSWNLSYTYKFRSSFDIDYTWEGSLIPYPNPDSLRTCWRTADLNQIITSSTKYLNLTAVNRFPLHFVSSDTKLLSIKYSLLVKQLVISEDAYNFYNAIEQQNIDQGDLWSKQPVQIRGNIHNVNNPDETVLGFFVVAGITEKRIFVERPEIIFYYTECTPLNDLRWIPFSSPSEWPIYLDDIMYSGLIFAERDACFDCRLDGGSLTPPDFWEE